MFDGKEAEASYLDEEDFYGTLFIFGYYCDMSLCFGFGVSTLLLRTFWFTVSLLFSMVWNNVMVIAVEGKIQRILENYGVKTFAQEWDNISQQQQTAVKEASRVASLSSFQSTRSQLDTGLSQLLLHRLLLLVEVRSIENTGLE